MIFDTLIMLGVYRTFVWGWGVHGQLGLGATDDHNIPTHLLLPQHVTAVAAGYSHTALLTIKVNLLCTRVQVCHSDTGACNDMWQQPLWAARSR